MEQQLRMNPITHFYEWVDVPDEANESEKELEAIAEALSPPVKKRAPRRKKDAANS